MTIRKTIVEGFDLPASNADLLLRGWANAEGILLTDGSGITGNNCYKLPASASFDVLSNVSQWGGYMRIAFWFKT